MKHAHPAYHRLHGLDPLEQQPPDAWSRQRAAILAELRRLGLKVGEAQSPLCWAAQRKSEQRAWLASLRTACAALRAG